MLCWMPWWWHMKLDTQKTIRWLHSIDFHVRFRFEKTHYCIFISISVPTIPTRLPYRRTHFTHTQTHTRMCMLRSSCIITHHKSLCSRANIQAPHLVSVCRYVPYWCGKFNSMKNTSHMLNMFLAYFLCVFFSPALSVCLSLVLKIPFESALQLRRHFEMEHSVEVLFLFYSIFFSLYPFYWIYS